MEWTDILRCPRTGAKLRLDEAASVLCAENSDTTYPIVDGIVDFCPETNDRIAAAYDKATRRWSTPWTRFRSVMCTDTNKEIVLWLSSELKPAEQRQAFRLV
ncbi:MAG: Trm112 family protein [Phycisphaerales bacterium]